ncbi:MAG: hypothetical protein ACXW2E_01395 [Nitrososphaeraceae archaeon]
MNPKDYKFIEAVPPPILETFDLSQFSQPIQMLAKQMEAELGVPVMDYLYSQTSSVDIKENLRAAILYARKVVALSLIEIAARVQQSKPAEEFPSESELWKKSVVITNNIISKLQQNAKS